MIEKIKAIIRSKRVLILGFGKEGQSTYRVLTQAGGYAQLDIADRMLTRPVLDGEHLFFTGETYMDTMDGYDLVFKSPGIVLPKPIGTYACRITSQTDIFLSEYGRQTIGVTGTKGKSTVSSLIYHTLSSIRPDCILAGNIGTPVFDIFERIRPSTLAILELSCHQLQYCTHSPSVAVMLNIYEDHLDHYPSFEDYRKAKTNIYAHQHALDVLFCNPNFLPGENNCVSRVVPVNTSVLPFTRFEAINVIKLRGTHNILNCAFVYQVCKLFNITEDAFIAALQSYQPLPHRLEYIGNVAGVDYYDDSISTTAESAISAVNSIHNAAVLLLGGMDRGIGIEALTEFIVQSRLTHVICMYESGKRMYEALQEKSLPHNANTPKLIYAPDLYQAVEQARQCAKPGTACILSPASASYGYFKNFEERGEVFKRLLLDGK